MYVNLYIHIVTFNYSYIIYAHQQILYHKYNDTQTCGNPSTCICFFFGQLLEVIQLSKRQVATSILIVQ